MKTTPDNRRPEHIAALRRALLLCRQATRQQLADASGLSTMTVGKLLGEMTARGEVCQRGTERQGSGRPSMIAAYNGDYAHFASIVVEQREGKSAFALSIVNLFGETVSREVLLLDEVRADSFDDFFSRMIAAGYRLRLAVLVLPGVAEDGEMLLCDFEELVRGQVLQRIRQRFGVEVLFENDVNAAVFGHGFDATDEVCAGIYFPRRYCPGAGVVVRGEILHGHRRFAGEVLYIQGIDRWLTLNYDDEAAAAEMIAQLLTVYACTVAPGRMVLYGDFFTPTLEAAIRARFDEKMLGRFDLTLTFQGAMTQDQERGAQRLGLRRMLELLDMETADEGKADGHPRQRQ